MLHAAFQRDSRRVANWDRRAFVGCTEKSIAFRVPMFKVVQIHTPARPPETYAPINAPHGTINPLATGIVGAATGALAGANCRSSLRCVYSGKARDAADF